MSFFGKMFGKKGEQAPTTGEAIQKLRETENMLIKKQEFLESKIEAELDIARKNGSKNKRGLLYWKSLDEWMTFRHSIPDLSVAIQALKRKKKYEKQLQQIDGTLSTIEMQREALESANTNTAVLTTMKNAADALKAAHNNMYVPLESCSFVFFFLTVNVSLQGCRSNTRHDGWYCWATEYCNRDFRRYFQSSIIR